MPTTQVKGVLNFAQMAKVRKHVPITGLSLFGILDVVPLMYFCLAAVDSFHLAL